MDETKIKTTIEVEVLPFSVPKRVFLAAGTVSRALSELDSLTLEMLCDQFRDSVFEKAGKQRPPQAGA